MRGSVAQRWSSTSSARSKPAMGRSRSSLAGRKQRALLARLLLDANRTVAIERLVDDLWGEKVPESAQKMVQIYVSQLRKVLPKEMLRTRPPGYAIEIDPATIDTVRFERLRLEGETAHAAGNATLAAERFREALSLWRGEPLAEFQEPFARAEAARLDRAVPHLPGGPNRRRPRSRPPRGARRRTRDARRPVPTAGGSPRATAGRAVPLGPPVGGAGGVPRLSRTALGRAWPRAVKGPQGPRAPDTQAGPRPRSRLGRSRKSRCSCAGGAFRDERRRLDRVPGGGRGAARSRARARMGVQLPAGLGAPANRGLLPQPVRDRKARSSSTSAERDSRIVSRGSRRSRNAWTTYAR